jgi:diaminopimelate epimerase
MLRTYARPVISGTGVRFVKGHGTENDFVLLPDPDGSLALDEHAVRRVRPPRRARRRRDPAGGAERARARRYADEARYFMDYRNADGSVAEMCGNGVRVHARYLVQAGLARPRRPAPRDPRRGQGRRRAAWRGAGHRRHRTGGRR